MRLRAAAERPGMDDNIENGVAGIPRDESDVSIRPRGPRAAQPRKVLGAGGDSGRLRAARARIPAGRIAARPRRRGNGLECPKRPPRTWNLAPECPRRSRRRPKSRASRCPSAAPSSPYMDSSRALVRREAACLPRPPAFPPLRGATSGQTLPRKALRAS